MAGGCGGGDFSSEHGAGRAGASSGGKGGATSGGASGSATGGTGGASGAAADGSGGSNGGTSGSGGALDASCADYIRAYCAWSARCTDEVFGGSVEACESLSATSCDSLALPGSGWNDASFGACAAGYESADCAPTEAICETPGGTLQNGFECVSALQCESNYCAITTSACGVCGPDPQHEIGGECEFATRDCKAGLDCVDGSCVAQQEAGGPCDDLRHCAYVRDEGYLHCVEGTCQIGGRLGEPCIGINGVCGAGSACSTDNVCIGYREVEEGEVCGAFVDEVIGCDDGACKADTDDPTVARCMDWARAGERCDKVPGFSRCATGLSCENNLCVWAEPQPFSNACDP
jgi:hypothetical protein